MREVVRAVAGLLHQRSLLWQMTKREVVGRYKGSVLGVAWSLFNPLLMLSVYTFVFSSVFNSRWSESGATQGLTDFAVVLFTGMLVHGLFSECITRAPALIVSNPNFVKKVVFPLEMLPCVSMGSALFHTAASFAVLLGGLALSSSGLRMSVLLFPIVLLPFVVLTMGISWFLAATGVFVRDLGHAVGLIATVMLFLSPVFYPVSSVPAKYQWLIHLNPLTFEIEQAREVLVWGRLPDWQGLGWYTGAGVIVAALGLRWFQKARRGFADVL
jgi:lipopolysaccharide transport system permease protein